MKRTGKRIISMLLCVLLASALSTTALAAEDGKVLKLAFTDSPTLVIGDMTIYHPSYAAMLAFKGAFEKSTGGEYSVELYPNGVLGDAASTMEQMEKLSCIRSSTRGSSPRVRKASSGSLRHPSPADGALSAFAPDIQVFTIPYLFDNPTIAYDVLDGDFGRQLFEKIAAETGFRVVASYDNGGYRNFTNSKREIRTAADMEGLNIRVQDSPVYLEMVEALGASATPVAFLELYSALQTGVVDGQENSCVTTLGASLDEVQPYCTLDGHLLGLAFLVISDTWYQGLDADTQAKVDEAGREATIAARGICRYAEALAVDTMVANGVQVYSPTAEELETFKVAQEPVMEYLKKNLSDPTLVDSLFSAIETAETMEDEGLTASGGGTQIAAAASQRGTLNLAAIAGIMVVLMAVVFLCTRRRGNEMEE